MDVQSKFVVNGQVTPPRPTRSSINTFRWDDETIVYPWRYSQHDFAKEPLYGMISTFGTNEELCVKIMDRCTGVYQQFINFEECKNYIDTLPMVKDGYCPLLAGNTKACRWTHTYLTIDELRPDIHCFHVGPQLEDPNGYVK
eukprot:UN30462